MQSATIRLLLYLLYCKNYSKTRIAFSLLRKKNFIFKFCLVIPQARSDKESSATAHNFLNHDLDSSIRIRSLRNDTYGLNDTLVLPCHSAGTAEESSAPTLNFHNHDLDSFIRIRSLRNDTYGLDDTLVLPCHSAGTK